mmetsp:Transcript_5544/g.10020  ORF Transcript_5544/g.10020 Transcript_5544/m.10020 type:complete len:197 (-) Transcript_5544:109-699(-)
MNQQQQRVVYSSAAPPPLNPPKLTLVRRDTSSDCCLIPARPQTDSMDVRMDDSFDTNNELESFFRPPQGSAPGRSESACRPETLTPDMTSRTFQSSPIASLPTFRRACHSSDGLENMVGFAGRSGRLDAMRDVANVPFSSIGMPLTPPPEFAPVPMPVPSRSPLLGKKQGWGKRLDEADMEQGSYGGAKRQRFLPK